MVYVELRSRYGNDWASHLRGGTETPYERDKRLSHMPTREVLPTSYMQLTELLDTVSCEWDLFKPYFPPRDVWEGKLPELKQIRHRVAHFRVGHRDDVLRVEQLLRDLDGGFWRFCTSYNDGWPVLVAEDAVATSLESLDPYGGAARAPLSMWVSHQRRPWSQRLSAGEVAGSAGYLYDVTLQAAKGRAFDVARFLSGTQRLHAQLCHICLGRAGESIRLTVPALLGAAPIAQLLDDLAKVGRLALGPAFAGRPALLEVLERVQDPDPMDLVAESYPEYVLGPANPLTFLEPNMPCSFFGVD